MTCENCKLKSSLKRARVLVFFFFFFSVFRKFFPSICREVSFRYLSHYCFSIWNCLGVHENTLRVLFICRAYSIYETRICGFREFWREVRRRDASTYIELIRKDFRQLIGGWYATMVAFMQFAAACGWRQYGTKWYVIIKR